MPDPKLTPAETPLLPPGVQWRVAEDNPPPLLAGDRVLVAVLATVAGSPLFFDILEATETGFDGGGGWDWGDVGHYCLLDPERTERDMPNE